MGVFPRLTVAFWWEWVSLCLIAIARRPAVLAFGALGWGVFFLCDWRSDDGRKNGDFKFFVQSLRDNCDAFLH